MSMQKRQVTIFLAVIAIADLNVAQAQDKYPVRPVRIVTSTPGGGNDFLARIVAPSLGNSLGQQVIVDNRPSRLVGGIAARSTPDGYTLVVGGSTMQYTPLMEKIDYNAITDFTPISLLERSPNVLVVNPALKVNSVGELVALARAKPGVMNYGTGASGASLHLSGELFMLATNTKFTRVPYKATGPAVLGLLTNEVQMVFATAGAVVPLLKDGKVKALGVTTAKPTPLVPGVPTVAQQGVPGFEVVTIGFILAPAKTPQPIVRLLNQHVVKLMQTSDVRDRLAGGGSEAVWSSPEELGRLMREDDARMRKLFKQLGLSADS
jgi:tripartite-type tricarboxylate transporter receptor subunit TctC